MKYIKTFEKVKTPKIGDYVICREVDDFNNETINQKLKNNIGQIIRSWNIETNNEDERMYFWVYFENIIDDGNFPNHVRPFYQKEIIMFAKDKEDLETQISANQYNL